MPPFRPSWLLAPSLFLALAAPLPASAQPAPGLPEGNGVATAALTPADRGWIARIQDTLNAITTLKGRFRQTAPDGAVTAGTVWLDRPGRMRFEYDRPSPLLLVAGTGRLVFTDSALKQTTEIPLDKTPLGLLLRPNLTLSGDVAVTGFDHAGGLLRVTVVRSASPSEGSLTLLLADGPLSLLGWTVIDAQGRATRIALSGLSGGGGFPSGLFDTATGN